ncbi:MAG: DUF2911 domain-containing protein, partial [Bacteroidota bacterium]
MKKPFHYRTFFCSKSGMKDVCLIVSILLMGCTSDPQRKPSPLRSDSTDIRGISAYIEFSSPAVRARKIFGNGEDYLVPFGNTWRTGANNATFIAISDKIRINDFTLDSGRYSLFTIPNQKEWTVILILSEIAINVALLAPVLQV